MGSDLSRRGRVTTSASASASSGSRRAKRRSSNLRLVAFADIGALALIAAAFAIAMSGSRGADVRAGTAADPVLGGPSSQTSVSAGVNTAQAQPAVGTTGVAASTIATRTAGPHRPTACA